VKHVLLRSSAFIRDSRRLLRRQPGLAVHLLQTLRLLEADPYSPGLKTHKLKGRLKDSWACSGGYDLRIVFSFTRSGGKPEILLETVGTHDEVY
jgi:mRNA interferase YafQ